MKLHRSLFGFRDYIFLPFSTGNHEQAKLYWIVRLRWLIIAFLLVLCPLGFLSEVLTLQALAFYAVALGMLISCNLLTQNLWLTQERKVPSIMVSYQLVLDLGILAGLLLLTGGMANPFYILFFVNVALGAVLLEGRRSFVFLMICHLALLLVQSVSAMKGMVDFSGHRDFYLASFAIQHLVLLISWSVNHSLGRYIALQQEKLSNVKVVAEKMDRLRSLGALTAGFSHEFASPLNTLKLRLARELRQQPESDNLQEMQMAIWDCEVVIQKMNSAQMDPREYHFRDIHLLSMTEEILRAWKNENPEALLQMKVEGPASDHLSLTLPLINYGQALMNVLDNAYEANPEGLCKTLIYETEGHVVLAVENEGSYFPDDVLKRFGEPFVTTKRSGTGLGLYSVQLFAQSIGGHAYLLNTNQGARVEIHFPKSLKRGGSL